MARTYIITETPVKTAKEQFKGGEDEKVKIIDIVLSMYPQLKRDRNIIINSVLGRIEKSSTTVLEKITHGKAMYYRDDDGKLFDVDVKLRGCYEITQDRYNFYLFDDDSLTRDMEEMRRLTEKFYELQNFDSH
jgi:hypothetical protein